MQIQTVDHMVDTGNSIAGEKFSVSKLQLNLYNYHNLVINTELPAL